MATVKTRINISLPDETEVALRRLAARDRLPAATKAARLIELALELEEDQIWDELAKKRDKKTAKFFSHTAAWKH